MPSGTCTVTTGFLVSGGMRTDTLAMSCWLSRWLTRLMARQSSALPSLAHSTRQPVPPSLATLAVLGAAAAGWAWHGEAQANNATHAAVVQTEVCNRRARTQRMGGPLTRRGGWGEVPAEPEHDACVMSTPSTISFPVAFSTPWWK